MKLSHLHPLQVEWDGKSENATVRIQRWAKPFYIGYLFLCELRNVRFHIKWRRKK